MPEEARGHTNCLNHAAIEKQLEGFDTRVERTETDHRLLAAALSDHKSKTAATVALAEASMKSFHKRMDGVDANMQHFIEAVAIVKSIDASIKKVINDQQVDNVRLVKVEETQEQICKIVDRHDKEIGALKGAPGATAIWGWKVIVGSVLAGLGGGILVLLGIKL